MPDIGIVLSTVVSGVLLGGMLALTALGEKVSHRVRKEIGQLINQRFSAYSREEVLRFGRMLDHFVFAKISGAPSPDGPPRPAIPAKRRRARARPASQI